jgi:hypothetical protein
MFLDIFEGFYRARALMDKTMAEHANAMTIKANGLSKMLLAKYQ